VQTSSGEVQLRISGGVCDRIA
jgi:hypothetical protein